MEKIIKLPQHRLPVLHKNAATISYENCVNLRKVYKEIIGLNNIHHFSINVVDYDDKMTILSYNPQIAYNIFKDGSYRYNGSISSTYYNNMDLYTWDETYDPKFHHILKNNMEIKNGIQKGVVLIKRTNGLTLLYSFATKLNGTDFVYEIENQKELFYGMGDHCFNQVSTIIEERIICSELKNKDKNSELGSNIIMFPKNV